MRRQKKAVTTPEYFPRGAVGIMCPKCGGYAERVTCTDDELKKYNCHPRAWECCARAYVCRLCGTRIAGSAEIGARDALYDAIQDELAKE